MRKQCIAMMLCTLVLTGCNNQLAKKESTLCQDKMLLTQLDDDNNTVDFILDEKYYKLPATLQDFYYDGWKIIDQIEKNPFVLEHEVLEANTSFNVVLFKDGYKKITATLRNTKGVDTLIVPDVIVTEIMINDRVFVKDQVVFKGGVTFDTTYQDAKKAILNKNGKAPIENNLFIGSIGRNSSFVFDDDALSFVMITNEVDFTYMEQNEIDLRVVDEQKSKQIELQSDAKANANVYSYKVFTKMLEKEKFFEAYYVKGVVVESRTIKQKNEFGESSIDVYIIKDENDQTYAVKADYDMQHITLQGNDEVELFANNAEALINDKQKTIPLLTPKVVVQEGNTIFSAGV